MDFSWAQICIIHDEGVSIIGNGRRYSSITKFYPKLKPRVPIVDLSGIQTEKWQKILYDYIERSHVEDVDLLLYDLEKLKKEEEKRKQKSK
jgi:hypothetical protein